MKKINSEIAKVRVKLFAHSDNKTTVKKETLKCLSLNLCIFDVLK